MHLDFWVIALLAPFAAWTVASGLDDLFITFVWLLPLRRRQLPSDARLAAIPERRIAIFVPLWREHSVIGQMLEHNLTSICYGRYDVFAGVYPNDLPTQRVVAAAARNTRRIHIITLPRNGPSSKGDCLNAIYRGMTGYEAAHGVHFEIIMTHDAEDLAHPQSLRIVNWFSRDHEMVQVPVLPLATPALDLTHGVYCDEFAEFQLKDIPMRWRMGSFIPSNGVGVGFERRAIEHLATMRHGLMFDPACMTEDYEIGLRLHELGYRQIFVALTPDGSPPAATREFFPRRWRSAVVQRSRWTTGIALQGWEQHGWRGSALRVYWFWRDRKGLVGNLLSPLCNLMFVVGLIEWRVLSHAPAWIAALCSATVLISLMHLGVRMRCSAAVYGWRFAWAAPLRMLWGNALNCAATASALRGFAAARARRRSLAWVKTDHAYPAGAMAARGRIGEVLIRLRCLSLDQVEQAAREQPAGERLGEYLVRMQKLSEETLYQALSVHAGIELGVPGGAELNRLATHALPAETARKWKVLPYRVDLGQLHLVTPEVPDRAMMQEIGRLATLELHFRLVRPREFERLAREYLPSATP